MITNKVYKLKQDTEVMKGVNLQAGQEIEVVMDVVYMNGYPLPPNLQPTFMAWLKNNPELFKDDTREW
jgi:hypothetical protein